MAGLEDTGLGLGRLSHPAPLRTAVIGAGWAGISAAIAAAQQGHRVSLFEAARQLGGRARALRLVTDQGQPYELDNGQHLLMSAYASTLSLMAQLGVDPQRVLADTPLNLRWPDGTGLALPAQLSSQPAAWQLLKAVIAAQGWSAREKLSMLMWGGYWQARGMRCSAHASVADLCTRLPTKLRQQWIEPLCISALNLPMAQASGQLFLNALNDTVMSAPSQWRGLTPKVALDQVLPNAAHRRLIAEGHDVLLGERVTQLKREAKGWYANGWGPFDHVVLATDAHAAGGLIRAIDTEEARAWAACVEAIEHTAIATVYLQSQETRTQRAMHALPTHHMWDAQFLFDWQRLGRAPDILAAVVSHAQGSASEIGPHVRHQVKEAFGFTDLSLIKTVVEKRATFAATPGLIRPKTKITAGLWACGDYVEGRYPATIEGAVRSAQAIPWKSLGAEA